MRILSGTVAALVVAGCGVSTQEFDDRTTELRRSEDRLARALLAERQAKQSAAELQKQIEDQQARVEQLEKIMRQMGVNGGADAARVKAALQADDEARAVLKKQAAERDQLATGLQEEIAAGLVRVEERNGAVRLVLPEEGLFAAGASRIGPPGKAVVVGVARALATLPTRRLLIAGHCDDKKGLAAWPLTIERSRQLLAELAKDGIPPGRMAAAGYAEFDPIADNATDEGRARNRRMEIVLVAGPEFVPPPPPAPPAPPAPKPVATAPAPPPPTPRKPPVPPAAPRPAAIVEDDPGLM
jgi:chemotaxis protein MotB